MRVVGASWTFFCVFVCDCVKDSVIVESRCSLSKNYGVFSSVLFFISTGLNLPNSETLRGILLHRFIQERACEPFDEREVWDWFKHEAKTMHLSSEVIHTLPIDALLRLPSCPEFTFLKKGRSEITIFEDGRILRLDNLYVDDDCAVLIEIKTGRHLSTNLQDLPVHHLRQIFTYTKVVKKIFPHRTVMAFLLETETASFIKIPETIDPCLEEDMRT